MKSLKSFVMEGIIQPSELGHPTDGMFDLLDKNLKANIKKYNESKRIDIKT